MIKINEDYLNLQDSYLFSTIAKKVNEYCAQNPESKIIRLGIGDVTLPLAKVCVGAMKQAAEEMGTKEAFHGYGPEQGYEFLREKIAFWDYQKKGISISKEEIYVSDGAKCDTANIQEIFGKDNVVAITDPVYPVYLDSNVMAGRSGTFDKKTGKYTKIVYMPVTKENGFEPQLPKEKVDMIYLCYPNNPTGTVLNKEQLTKWVQYAKENQAILFYDAAYEAFIAEEGIPHSIYEIEGANDVAIEFRSFSKTAGFTGIRCGYVVIPQQLQAYTKTGEAKAVGSLWNRRQSSKFNGVSYVTQKAAEAIYTEAGQQEIQEKIAYYMENAKLLRQGLTDLGYEVYGGKNAPYIWLKVPQGYTSWEFFDELLQQVGIVGTPGAGFGPSGEGYFRLTAFGTKENTMEALERIKKRK